VRVFYGDPEDPLDVLLGGASPTEPPEHGDELCDGHLMHYEWVGDSETGWWRGWKRPKTEEEQATESGDHDPLTKEERQEVYGVDRDVL
jgi:hypothetical protein